MRLSLLALLLLIISIFCDCSSGNINSSVLGKHYYISPQGDDHDFGTKEYPWRTLDKANKTLRPGDTVTVSDGLYEGLINPEFSGKNNQRIVYRSENRHGAILKGDEGSKYVINLINRHFITIDGFKMLPHSGGFGYIKDCSSITLENCHMEHSTEVYCPLRFVDSHHNRLLFNTLYRVIQRTSDSKIHGDGCHFINSSFNVIEGNDFSKIGHSPLRIWGETPGRNNYNVVRSNIFHNGWGRNFEMFNLDRCLFERNIITNAFNGAMSADAHGKVFLTDGIFRENLIYDNWDSPLASYSYIDRSTTGDVPLELKDSRFYNNTFANNASYVWGFSGRNNVTPIRSNVFKNNIFSNNGFMVNFITLILGSSGVADNNQIQNNLFYGNISEMAVIQIKDNIYTANRLNEEYSHHCSENLNADPGFISNDDRCFALNAMSIAKNGGTFLTRTSAPGRGSVIPVEDARYFYDGFGIEGEKGDLIIIGPSKLMARVIISDMERNELTIDRELIWKEGEHVSLPFPGSTPDIGAIQNGDIGMLNIIPTCHPYITSVGNQVYFSTIQRGVKGDIKMTWDLGDGNVSNEESPLYIYDVPGDYVVRFYCMDEAGNKVQRNLVVRVEKGNDIEYPLIQTGFEEEDFEEWGHLWDRGSSRGLNTYYPEKRDDGKGQCMCVSTEGRNDRLETNIKMRIWDIDQYPFVQFSYRIPNGVPVGVWVETWPGEKHPVRIYLGGSVSNSSAGYPNIFEASLKDDYQWNVAKIDVRKVRKILPGIRYFHVFGFSTETKTEEGQKFWFDDFAITSIK
jgi:hypothetical protein